MRRGPHSRCGDLHGQVWCHGDVNVAMRVQGQPVCHHRERRHAVKRRLRDVLDRFPYLRPFFRARVLGSRGSRKPSMGKTSAPGFGCYEHIRGFSPANSSASNQKCAVFARIPTGYGSTVMATRNGAEPVFLDRKSMRRTWTSGRGLAYTIVNNRTVAPVAVVQVTG